MKDTNLKKIYLQPSVKVVAFRIEGGFGASTFSEEKYTYTQQVEGTNATYSYSEDDEGDGTWYNGFGNN